MNALRSVFALLSFVVMAPFAVGCAMSGAEDDSALEATADGQGALICTTCDNETPHDPPKHPDFIVLPGYTASVGTDGLWYVYLTIKNQGTAAGFAGILGVSSGYDGQPVGGMASVSTNATLQPGQTKVVHFALGDHGDPDDAFCIGAYNYPCIGDSLAPYYLKVRIDAWSQTFESNETNNTLTIDL